MNPAPPSPVVTDDPVAAGWRAGGCSALFLDRDGVINLDHGHVHSADRTDWMPGIFDLAAAARRSGFVIVVVTNQAGIARGYYDDAQFRSHTRWMHGVFADAGSPLLATYYCPQHPDALSPRYRTDTGCRKPQPGMLLAAARDWDINLSASVLVGDQPTDIEAARRAGIGTMFRVAAQDLGPVLRWFGARSAD